MIRYNLPAWQLLPGGDISTEFVAYHRLTSQAEVRARS
jgi:hypothetical protein